MPRACRALPVLNEQAMSYAMPRALALGCEVGAAHEVRPQELLLSRLPKGYQISQYDIPLASGGRLGDVRIQRVHLEEDAGKKIHEGDPGGIPAPATSLVDLNRAGMPLIEIVSEPDLRGPEEARECARLLRNML